MTAPLNCTDLQRHLLAALQIAAAAAKSLQTCPILCDPMDCSPPGSSVHGTVEARLVERIAIPFSRGSSWPRNQTCKSCTAGAFFTIWANRAAPETADLQKYCAKQRGRLGEGQVLVKLKFPGRCMSLENEWCVLILEGHVETTDFHSLFLMKH